MKKIVAVLSVVLLIAMLFVEVASANSIVTFPYEQFSSGGTPAQLEAVILMENSNSTFTKYQVGFTSCTCRGAENNFRSVMYIELLNKRKTPSESAVRSISFGINKGILVGMWGDSNPVYQRPEYTYDYMNEHFVQLLVGTTKAEFDAWEGYGHLLSAIDADAVSGATVSTSNIISVIRGLFEYHAEKYFSAS